MNRISKIFWLLLGLGIFTCINGLIATRYFLFQYEAFERAEVKLNTEVRGNATFSFTLPAGFPARIRVDAEDTSAAYSKSPDKIEMTIHAPELGIHESLPLKKYEESDAWGSVSYYYENSPFEFENTLSKEISYEVVLRPEEEGEYEVGIYHNYEFDNAESYIPVWVVTVFLALIFLVLSVDKRDSDYFIHSLAILSNILLWLVYTSILAGFFWYLTEVPVPAP